MKKSFMIKGKIFGESRMLTCVSVIGENKERIIQEISNAISKGADVIEWRSDYFSQVRDLEEVTQVLDAIKLETKTTPVIFTCRHGNEGGQTEVDQRTRLKLIECALHSKAVDLVDVEMFNGESFLAKVRLLTEEKQKKLILSYHNFQMTPQKNFVTNKFLEGQAGGAHMVKVALMPRTPEDVLTLLNAANEIGKQTELPIIAISMGELGRISRIWGEYVGSCLSYVTVEAPSAPGQLAMEDFKEAHRLLMGKGI
jgi:3-dehydroquinate dehydratase-1